jgi:hypothetical protein
MTGVGRCGHDAGRRWTPLKFFATPPIYMRKATNHTTSDMAQGQGREQRLQEEDSMSSPITPSPGVTAAPTLSGRGISPTRRAAAPFPPPAVSMDALPASPPPEVLEQMADAARTYEDLSGQGRELRFATDAQSGRTRIEVRDRAGRVLQTLSPAQALAVAAGAPLE